MENVRSGNGSVTIPQTTNSSNTVKDPNAVVITHAVRTPIGRFLGGFSKLSGPDLGVAAVKGLFARAGVAATEADYLIFGMGRQAGSGPNIARQVSVRSGMREAAPAFTVNMACASGLKAILLAADAISAGRVRVAVAGGCESMTNLPFLLPKMRTGYRIGHDRVVDGMYQDGFLCPLSKLVMGETAEKLAKQMNISRGEQDQCALESQQKCEAARKANRYEAEIVNVEAPGERGASTIITKDEHPRDGATLESLAKLPPVFDAKTGTVTAGNASGITDGAAAVLLMSEAEARRRELPILAKVGAASEVGVDPSIMGIGPVPAVRELLERTHRKIDNYDLIELNEAFAAQVVACDRELKFPKDRLNVNGGAIALGHPIGATGARIVVTMLHEMQRRNSKIGLATLCVSGGMGVAVEFEG
ncbi:MAG: thiolase family protein [Planctomycetes bacterium]|nr:thiolase family protein [Planctomycetota bacterium]